MFGDNAPLIEDPIAVFTFLITLIGGVYLLGEWGNRFTKRFFKYAPPLIWTYFLPMFATSLGITPSSSPVYDFAGVTLLPVALFLLLLSANIPATIRLGPRALVMFFTGTFGIVLGAPIALLLFQSALPDDVWKGMAPLAASWTGGSENFAALATSLNTPRGILSPMLVIDAIVTFCWLGIMIFMAGYQEKFDRWNKADNSVIKELSAQMSKVEQERAKPVALPQLLGILGVGFGVAFAVGKLSELLPQGSVVNAATWTIMIIAALGVVCSFTPVRKLEDYGASKVGYAGIYLLLATLGAQADLSKVIEAPVYILMGATWLAVHVVILFVVARLVRAPLFFVAVSSQANVGGSSSAPALASVFHPALAPAGLLMAVLGNVLGTYMGVLVAKITQAMS